MNRKTKCLNVPLDYQSFSNPSPSKKKFFFLAPSPSAKLISDHSDQITYLHPVIGGGREDLGQPLLKAQLLQVCGQTVLLLAGQMGRRVRVGKASTYGWKLWPGEWAI